MRTLRKSPAKIVSALLLACAALGSIFPAARGQTFETVLNTNLFQPASISVSDANEYIIADTANHRVVKFSPDSRAFSVLAGPDRAPIEAGAVDGKTIDARFRNPQSVLAVGDLVYVADTGNHAIRVIDKAGNVRTIAGDLATAHLVDDYGGTPENWGFVNGPADKALFNGPSGLATDGAGHLYIADSGNNAIRILDLNTHTVSTVVNSGLSTPVALALGPNGAIFISDAGSHSIKAWRPADTKARLVAGGGTPLSRGYKDSGKATDALFSAPGGIYYREASDELIVADSGNGVLRTVQNVSTTSPNVATFGNSGAAGFQTPIAVTRDLYGVFLVADSTRSAIDSVITVRFPRIDRPAIGHIIVVVNDKLEREARLVPVTDATFDNLVRVAISGDPDAQHRFEAISSPSDTAQPAAPSTNSATATNFRNPTTPAPADSVLDSYSLNQGVPPRYNFRIKAYSGPKDGSERIPSLTTEALFRFKCATPQLDSQTVPGRLLFRCNTTNAVIYYTTDGTEPVKDSPTVQSIRSGDSIPLVVKNQPVVVKARGYMDSAFIPSEVARAEFTPENFVPNRISLGFAEGEASSTMRAAPGQRFFAPVTLSLMQSAKAYGLQFDLSLQPLQGPGSGDYQLAFDSGLMEKLGESYRSIPPSVFVLNATNFVTNLVTTIDTNYNYQLVLTNYSASAATNYVILTNRLPELVPVVTSTFVTNLGQVYPIFATNYITNGFTLVSDSSLRTTNTLVETNYLYQYASPSITNLVTVDSELPATTPVVITNFVSNLGKLFSYATTNYLTNSFNRLSSTVVANRVEDTTTNYIYLAVTPGVTNYVSLDHEIASSIQVIVTNFVENLGQQFPVVTTNTLTSAFDLVSVKVQTNTLRDTITNFTYRATTSGTNTILVLNELLPDFTPILVTNLVQNLGRTFSVVSTNYISNSFNLLSVRTITNNSPRISTNYVYEIGTPGVTNRLVLDRVLPDATQSISTNFIDNMGDKFPVVTTNIIANAFDLISSDIKTNALTTVSTNFLYEAGAANEPSILVLDHFLKDQTPVVTTNFISNMGEQFPVVKTNYIDNAFNFVSASIVTNTTETILTNFSYRAVIPGSSNLFQLTSLLPDNMPLITTNFVTNLGQLFPVPQTNYIFNAFDLVSASITTNVQPLISTSVVYRSITKGSDYFVTLDRFLPDEGPVVTSIAVQNQGIFYAMSTTNLSPNIFDLVSSAVRTTVVNQVIYDYAYAPVAVTNFLLWPTPLDDGTSVVTTNQLILGRRAVELAVTNTVSTAENFVSPVLDHGSIRYLYSFTNATPAGTLTSTQEIGAGPLVQLLTTGYITNLDQTFTIGLVQQVTNPIITTFVSTNVTQNISTSVVYKVSTPYVTNYLTLSTNLPDVAPVVNVTSITNLGTSYPMVSTNYATNVFELVSTTYATNFQTTVTTNAVYRSIVPPVTNILQLAAQLPDTAPIVTTTFLTNLGQLFPISATNYIANWFDFLGETHSTKSVTTVQTNVIYSFTEPSASSLVVWPELLPDSIPFVTTNFIVNLGKQFPVIQTNYLSNSFRLLGQTTVTNVTTNIAATVVYEFRTPGSTTTLSWPQKLPDRAPIVTTNFVSNLGQLFPVASTNYLTNAFRLLGVTFQTNNSPVETEAIYSLSTEANVNYLDLPAKLPDSILVVTTNFISNLGQVFPVTVTNILRNTFDLISTNVVTNTRESVSTNVLYALRTPSVTNVVYWPVKLPDSLSIVTTNFITNLTQSFPVTFTNKVLNVFNLVGTNSNTSVSEEFSTNIVYEFHTAGVTNFFTLPNILPDFIQVITTNFVENLGQRFPVMQTNITENLFDLIATNQTTNVTVDITPNYIYSVITPGAGPQAQASITTNLLSLTTALPDVIPIIDRIGTVTNLNDVYPVYTTNYVSNSFRLANLTYTTNTFEIAKTNASSVFADLIITNTAQTWMAVGWIERFGQTNLYNTKQQNLLSYSIAHNSLFLGSAGEAIAGSFSFVVPTNSATGDRYQLRISRPSATADGVSQDMYLQAPEENDTNSPVKAVRTLVVTNVVGYIPGDVSDFRWFNAGEFGDGNILNADLTELQQAIVYGVNLPPQDSDYLDAMDTCCYTEDGRDLSRMDFASGGSININEIAFGDGSRPPPLGNRPYSKLDVNDLFVAYRRSVDPNLVWYQRYWSNGVRKARVVPNAYRDARPLSRQSISATALPSGPAIQSTQEPALTLYAGAATGLPGQTVAVPIHARVDGGFPLRTLMFNARVVTSDDTIVDGSSINASLSDPLGVPPVLFEDAGMPGAAWLETSVAGILGDKVVARVLFTIPANASPTTLYYVKLDRVSGSPNGISLFPVRSGTGIISMANRPSPAWNDGIPDAWRQKYFGTLSDPRSAAAVDADGDGLSNYDEYKLGTNPLDANDDLRIEASANGYGVKIRFHSANGRYYRIEGSTTLQPGSWITIQNNVVGTGNDIELPTPGGAHNYYYRVRLQE